MTTTRELKDESAVRALLVEKVEEVGSQAEFARQHRLRPDDVNFTYRGARPPSRAILLALGYRRVVRYQKGDLR